MTGSGCECWANTYALGHGGHCCFVRDDRDRRGAGGWWRPDVEVCHVPAVGLVVPPVMPGQAWAGVAGSRRAP